MRKAIIDLGTNTFNLLIADLNGSKFEIVHAEKEGVAIGMGGINSNVITEDSMLRGEKAIKHFLTVCFEKHVDKILAFGTSALRDAENTNDFLQKLKDECDLNVHIISGEMEAELIYRGVRQVYDFEHKGVIIDIGGGSTEVVFADANGVNELMSLNIGVSRIYQKFKFQDPLVVADILTIRKFLEEESKGFFDDRNEEIMIGSSGSFETFWEMTHERSMPEEKQSFEMSIDGFKSTLQEVIKSTLKEREANAFILPIRKIMAPITAVKTLWLMEKLQTKRIIISPFSLKEGALVTEEF
jgi:exopolyphosphatase/guanosine-5'-triphosphate,3'-diphosphate pyrophosphatase|tara:strand:+ start:60263 stop:61159 length:897 start_codon:yes stop_codon:yes gene_type:complete